MFFKEFLKTLVEKILSMSTVFVVFSFAAEPQMVIWKIANLVSNSSYFTYFTFKVNACRFTGKAKETVWTESLKGLQRKSAALKN